MSGLRRWAWGWGSLDLFLFGMWHIQWMSFSAFRYCLSALLSLSAEPSFLGRLIPRLSHKTVPVTAGHWHTDQPLASSTETSHLKRYRASSKRKSWLWIFPLVPPAPQVGQGPPTEVGLFLFRLQLYFISLSNLIRNLYLHNFKVCSQRA